MKIIFYVILLFAFVCGFCANANAATEEWSVPLSSNYVYQCYADGNGGAAIVYLDGSGNTKLLWLDKKGKKIYEDTITDVSAGGILGCTKKDLVFADSDSSTNRYVYHVNSDGQKETLAAPVGTFNTVPNLTYSFITKAGDKKGFFATFTNTNDLETTFVRYRNK